MKINHLLTKMAVLLPLLAVFTQSSVANQIDGKTTNKSVTNYITEDGFYKKLKKENNKVYFDFDKSNIKPMAANILDMHAKYLLANPMSRVLIEGHTDEKGSIEYNLSLGERRALEIKDYLLNKGVSEKQLYTISFGKDRLAFLDNNDASRAKNRRGVIVYY